MSSHAITYSLTIGDRQITWLTKKEINIDNGIGEARYTTMTTAKGIVIMQNLMLPKSQLTLPVEKSSPDDTFLQDLYTLQAGGSSRNGFITVTSTVNNNISTETFNLTGITVINIPNAVLSTTGENEEMAMREYTLEYAVNRRLT